MPFRILTTGPTIECDTFQELLEAANHMGITLVSGAPRVDLSNLGPATAGFPKGHDHSTPVMMTSPLAPVKITNGANLERPSSSRQASALEKALQPAVDRVTGHQPVKKTKAARVAEETPQAKARAAKGSFQFLNELGLNKSKTVEGFTYAQIGTAITRNKAESGKSFVHEALGDGKIKVKRTA